MAGVRQFDLDEVLGRAMSTFWERGYEATSIHDLVKATGINRGSIYATFGDKKGLFLACLEHYARNVAAPLIAELSDPDPRQALQRMFDAIVRRTSDLSFPRGCLYTNTSLECPGSGDDITRKIAERVAELETAIYEALRRAQLQGSLDPARDPKALARMFIGVVQGMNVLNKTVGDPNVLKDMARVAMSLLYAPAEAPASAASS
jgi:TetR/AcrR family transcriptional repressor of nem operon